MVGNLYLLSFIMKYCFLILINLLLINSLIGQTYLNEPPISPYEAHIAKGEAFLIKQDYGGAVEEYRKALHIDSSDTLIIEKYKFCLFRSGSGCDAFGDLYNDALETAGFLFEHKAYKRAEKCYLIANDLFPFEEEPKVKLKEVRAAMKEAKKLQKRTQP